MFAHVHELRKELSWSTSEDGLPALHFAVLNEASEPAEPLGGPR